MIHHIVNLSERKIFKIYFIIFLIFSLQNLIYTWNLIIMMDH